MDFAIVADARLFHIVDVFIACNRSAAAGSCLNRAQQRAGRVQDQQPEHMHPVSAEKADELVEAAQAIGRKHRELKTVSCDQLARG